MSHTPTPGEKVAELLRDLSVRQRVYPLWVKEYKITQEEANHRLAVLKALIEDMYRLYPQLRPMSVNEPLPPCRLDH